MGEKSNICRHIRAERCVFARSNSAGGCLTFLRGLPGCGENARVVLLRSGGGGAAEALLRTLAKQADALGGAPQLLFDGFGREHPCALCIPPLRGSESICFLDAEAPYALEAKIPGGGEELFSLDACRQNAQLREKRKELCRAQENRTRELQRAARFLRAAAAMKRNMAVVAAETLDRPKLKRFAAGLADRKLPAPNGHIGHESRRFLTALSGQGILLRGNGLTAEFPNMVVLEDDSGAVAPLLWDILRAYALGSGLDVISCPCLLAPEDAPEHLLIPELGLAFLTANRRHPLAAPGGAAEGARRILASRFFDRKALQAHGCRLRFCRRALRELLEEAHEAQTAAENAKAALDAIYAPALLPGAIERAAKRLLRG
ncbi:MAG: hypothetical protein LBC83_00090 [Oscillospiraceae bacterium]|jgi:hypothetical protein|nr:hypothetical protein [Oscillospiraceae bacterium]